MCLCACEAYLAGVVRPAFSAGASCAGASCTSAWSLLAHAAHVGHTIGSASPSCAGALSVGGAMTFTRERSLSRNNKGRGKLDQPHSLSPLKKKKL